MDKTIIQKVQENINKQNIIIGYLKTHLKEVESLRNFLIKRKREAYKELKADRERKR